jgi:hypothetical protein
MTAKHVEASFARVCASRERPRAQYDSSEMKRWTTTRSTRARSVVTT